MKTFFIKWHNTLLWFGLATVLIWAISGISHPMMAWFGPQATKMFPPSLTVNGQDAAKVKDIIKTNQLSHAAIAKIVPTADGAMLQLTEQEANNKVQRRYFSLTSQQETINYDEKQARWLAAYYTGLDIENTNNVTLIEEFSHEYPWVNRLLPVYHVDFKDDDLSAYVYTETNALASLNNTTKQRMQGFFQILHTWSFLDFTGFGRVFLVGLLMLTLVAMASTGLMLVISIARRKISDPSRRWHRVLAYLLWLPMLAWPASGFYHLLQAQYVDPVAGLRLSEPVNLQEWLVTNTTDQDWQQNFSSSIADNHSLNAVSLVSSGGKYFYRLSQAQDKGQAVSRNARFDGKPSEKSVLYIDSQSGERAVHSDKDQAQSLVANLLGEDTSYNSMELVTRFGPGYDFRNKRLPVWQINLDDEQQTHVFVDPTTSILVDQNRNIDRLESLSFSLLHKWNHLFPFIGREARDILIVLTLIACLFLTGLGIQMYFVRRKRVLS